jgi:hypothetical protein
VNYNLTPVISEVCICKEERKRVEVTHDAHMGKKEKKETMFVSYSEY